MRNERRKGASAVVALILGISLGKLVTVEFAYVGLVTALLLLGWIGKDWLSEKRLGALAALTITVPKIEIFDAAVMTRAHNIGNPVARLPAVLLTNKPAAATAVVSFALRYRGDGTTGPENEALASQDFLRSLRDLDATMRQLSKLSGTPLPEFPPPLWYDRCAFDAVTMEGGATRQVDLAFVLVSSAKPPLLLGLEITDAVSGKTATLPGAAGKCAL